MATVFRMPEVAANGTEAVLQEWVVAEGASYDAGDTIATVETDKAVVDVEADEAGSVLRTLVPAGSTVEVGAPIAVLVGVDETVGDVAALMADLGVDTTGTTPTTAPERRVVPESTVPAPTAPVPPEPEVPPGAAQPAEPEVPARGEVSSGPGVDASGPSGTAAVDRGGRVFASPLARRLAAEAGIPVERITGTGPGGRVRRRDVDAAIAAAAPQPPARAMAASADLGAAPAEGSVRASGPTAPATAAAAPALAGSAGFTDVPHTRMRRAIASRLLQSKQTTPHFYLRAAVEVDPLLQLRAELNEDAGTRISVNDLVVKAAAAAHVQVPDMNVVWTDDALRRFEQVDISVAVAVDGGLLTPVVRDVASLAVGTVASTTRELVERARAGRLGQAELEGGSLSVTNLGMYGTQEFAAIINPPQSAILAVGAARQEVVARDGAPAVATVMRVTLSVDHRAVDGAVAAQWLAAFTGLVERPLRLLR